MFELELDKLTKIVKKNTNVLIQLPDGLKNQADKIASRIEHLGAQPIIWIGSCFGACDIPKVSEQNIDLLIQWGHSPWNY